MEDTITSIVAGAAIFYGLLRVGFKIYGRFERQRTNGLIDEIHAKRSSRVETIEGVPVKEVEIFVTPTKGKEK